MKQRTIGDVGVSEIGLGCMGMSWAYGSADPADGKAVLRRARELGVNHWDTADLYGAGANEELVGQALKEDGRDGVFLATKFGNVYDRTLTSHQDLVEAKAAWIVDGTPEYVRASLDRSLARLGVDQIDLYYAHRIDDRVPVEDTVGAMAEGVAAGKIRFLGVSEVNGETLRRAHAVHPIAAVQNELSLWTRDSIDDVIPVCEELGIAFVAYSPLGRGFLTGAIKDINALAEDDGRRNMPRFTDGNLGRNWALVEAVTRVADRKGARPSQVALAWTLAVSPRVLPIPGTKRVKYLEENSAAAEVDLNDEDLSELEAVPEAQGDRYAQFAMAFTKR